MIIGDNRPAVIENIRRAVEQGEFYNKVELHDPVLTPQQSRAIIDRYLRTRDSLQFRAKSLLARQAADLLTRHLNRTTRIIGLENAEQLTGGAILTSNHFSPADNTVVRTLAKRLGKRRLYIVSQESNLAMPGALGFLMNYADIIPISGSINYMHGGFMELLDSLLKRGEFVLIYPEQEMWFHYRKPRPGKRGAYFFASKLQVPVRPCFVELQDTDLPDTDEFMQLRYVMHVGKPLYPDPSKTVRENSLAMCRADDALKRGFYEAAYGKALSYTFAPSDIAGWRVGTMPQPEEVCHGR